VWHRWHCDEDYGRRVAAGAGIDLEEAKSLPPLPGKPPPGEKRPASTYTSGQSEASQPRQTFAARSAAK
jgi:catalase